MPTQTVQVSNYFVLQDANFELSGNNIKRFTAKMPAASQFVKGTARPVLSFTMEPLSDNLKFLVLLNDLQGDPNNIPASKVVINYDFTGSRQQVLRTFHEVLDGNQFLPGVDNTIDFRVITGQCRFADILLHFRMNITFQSP